MTNSERLNWWHERNPYPNPPGQEVVSIGEVKYSMDLLREFGETEATVTNLDELVSALRGDAVGRAFRAVAISYGEFRQGEVETLQDEGGDIIHRASMTQYNLMVPKMKGHWFIQLYYDFNSLIPFVGISYDEGNVFDSEDKYRITMPAMSALNQPYNEFAKATLPVNAYQYENRKQTVNVYPIDQRFGDQDFQQYLKYCKKSSKRCSES